LGEGVLNEAQALIELLAHVQEMDEIVPLIALVLAKDLGFQDLGHRPCRYHTAQHMILGPSRVRARAQQYRKRHWDAWVPSGRVTAMDVIERATKEASLAAWRRPGGYASWFFLGL
jgi:hypothetical protein